MEQEKIGRYEIQSKLGQGGMATVYEAYDPTFGRNVAVKVLPREFLHDPQFRSRFEREAKTIAGLENQGVVPVYDFGEIDGQPFLVMRLMSGGSLSSRIREAPLSLEDAIHIVERVGMALAAAHSKGVIHRDLKPANILFDSDGNPNIADFGIVKLAENTSMLTGSGMVGTPAYMAPEMTDKGGLTPLVDIYAMGVTLYQMLVGELPFNADTPMGMIGAHLAKPVPDVLAQRSDLPDDIQYVIEKAMAKNPTERYQSMSEMVADLKMVAQGQFDPATMASPINPALPTAPAVTRPRPAAPKTAAAPRPAAGLNPIWIGSGVVAAVAVVGIALFAFGILPPHAAEVAPTETLLPPSATPVSLIPTAQTSGTVEITAQGSSIIEALDSARPLRTGDTIRVGADGLALLTFASGVSVELQPGASLSIDRLEETDNTIHIELTLTAGTAYHILSPDQSGLARDYTVHTPLGTTHAVGTRLWTSQRENGWLFAPTDSSITLEVGDTDTNDQDNFTLEAAQHDCLIINLALTTEACDLAKIKGLAPLTDGLTLSSQPTATAFVGGGGGAPGPTSTTAVVSTNLPPTLAPVCGNGVCEPGEDSSNCPTDCGAPPPSGGGGGGGAPTSPPAAFCGDGACNGGEQPGSAGCVADCGCGACGSGGTNTICFGVGGCPACGPVNCYNVIDYDLCGNPCHDTGPQCGNC